ncbi:hypothetical protein ACJVC5_07260 [Peredibacter sp. HCB2-198]|uniref:hypothetical protein n=1 Tax=Peredibacter sp. HCB2-198 TaxID=3383025 RepID=UPI0038B59C78
MKSKNTEATQRILVLLKIDANNLFKRIKERKSEYLEIFALRRTREHFPMIFKNRYEGTSIMDLSHCSTDLITTLDQFYTLVEEMSWYLFQTEDMPNTVEDYIDRKIRRMEKLLSTLNLFLDAELGIESEQAQQETEVRFIDQEPDFSDSFNDDTSQET